MFRSIYPTFKGSVVLGILWSRDVSENHRLCLPRPSLIGEPQPRDVLKTPVNLYGDRVWDVGGVNRSKSPDGERFVFRVVLP